MQKDIINRVDSWFQAEKVKLERDEHNRCFIVKTGQKSNKLGAYQFIRMFKGLRHKLEEFQKIKMDSTLRKLSAQCFNRNVEKIIPQY
jgi:hypothetical protein